MESFLKFFRTSSLVLAVGVFLYVYAWMPEGVTVSVDAVGNSELIVTKDSFFFGGLIFLLSINGVFFIYLNLLKNMKVRKISGGLTYRNPIFRHEMIQWFLALNGILNLGFILSMAFLASFNNQQFGDGGVLGNTIFLFPVVMLAAMVWLVVILSKNRR
ncbi:hypothetical protein [Persicobacter diffluens]|uniref:DUF1648 domain-containing protein n=1 Tax=Persicobacter diffluens TaxID=981 RepID=A0AAN4VUZ2_9BACT|nr:hypothetical protein PEDI_09930 [Persicobacter diffluens]